MQNLELCMKRSKNKYEYTKHILHIRTHDQFAVLSMYVETIESAYLILFNENLCKCGYY